MIGRIEIIIGPHNDPAEFDRAVVVYIGTLTPWSMCAIADAAILQRRLEREAAADDEGHQVVAPPGSEVGGLVHQHTVLINRAAGHVGPDVPARQQRIGRLPCLQHGQDRAGLRIALREQHHV